MLIIQEELSDHWIVPVIQGYVQLEKCVMDFSERRASPSSDATLLMEFPGSTKHKDPLAYTFGIISLNVHVNLPVEFLGRYRLKI
jgi:hypothetical protein